MASPPSHSQSVLPNSKILLLESIKRDENGFILEVRTCQRPRCPDCGELSRSCHSHYCRRLQDLPWQGLSVRIRLKARRFRCRNPECGRKIFVERLPEVVLPHARQTQRLSDIVRLIGFVVGGLPGSRLLARLAIATSDDTVLRRVKMRPQPDAIEEPIRSLGVDDWAWRKGQDYGTILVDLERHRVADLLPERSAEGLACQHRYKTTAFPSVLLLGREAYGEDVVRTL
jgi:transposase